MDEDVRYEAWVVAAPGLESVVEKELRDLGFTDLRRAPGGVSVTCSEQDLAKANLWLRTASRIIVRIASFRAVAFHELERAARKVEWNRFLSAGGAFALRVTCRKSRLYHSDAVAERVAGAIVRKVKGAVNRSKGSVDDEDHDEMSDVDGGRVQLFVVRIERDKCVISVDSSGELLHRRGYRQAVAKAPLRETLAASLLLAAPWNPETPLVDPMCGSGTIVIEGAMLARRIAPGLNRSFAAEAWPEFDQSWFTSVRREARQLILPRASASIQASDRDAGAIEAARANAERAGVADDIEFVQSPVSNIAPSDNAGAGLVVTNPPYGVRVGESKHLRDLFARLGQVLHERFVGWDVGLLSANPRLDAETRLDFTERIVTMNGGIPVRFIVARIPEL